MIVTLFVTRLPSEYTGRQYDDRGWVCTPDAAARRAFWESPIVCNCLASHTQKLQCAG